MTVHAAGRLVLAAAAITALVATVGLLDAHTMPGWMLPAAAVTAAVAGSARYWTRLITRHRAPVLDRHTEPVPGGAIGWTVVPGSWRHHDTVAYPADPHGPVTVGTVDPIVLGQLRAAPDALALRARALMIGGMR